MSHNQTLTRFSKKHWIKAPNVNKIWKNKYIFSINNGTLLRKYKIMNNNEITSVGPVDMQYICPCGLGIIVGKMVITREIPYNEWNLNGYQYCIRKVY